MQRFFKLFRPTETVQPSFQALMQLTANNRFDELENRLNELTDVNMQSADGNTLLHVIANRVTHDNTGIALKILKELLNRGANPNIKNKKNETPVYWWTSSLHCKPYQQNVVEIAKTLLTKKADPNILTTDDSFTFPYHDTPACCYFKIEPFINEPEITKLFMKIGADPFRGNQFNPPYTLREHLMRLISFSPIEDLPFLLKNASTILITEFIDYAATCGRADVLSDIFENYKTDPQFQFLKNHDELCSKISDCLNQDTLLKPSVKLALIKKIKGTGIRTQKTLDKINQNEKLLLTKMEENKNKNANEETELSVAYINKMILAEGAPEEKKESEELFLQLLDNPNSHINARGTNNQTLLHQLVTGTEKSLFDLVFILLKGANPNARDRSGKTPLDYLLDIKNQEDTNIKNLIEILDKGIDHFIHPDNKESLWKMFGKDDLSLDDNVSEIINFLQPYIKAYPYQQDMNGNILLHRYILKNDIKNAMRLLDDPDIKLEDINKKNKGGNTPLHLALTTEEIHPELIDKLLNKGADPTPLNKSHETPLHLAYRKKEWNTVLILLDKMTGPPTSTMLSIFRDAISYGQEKIVDFFINKYPEFLFSKNLKSEYSDDILRAALSAKWNTLMFKLIQNDISKNATYINEKIFSYALENFMKDQPLFTELLKMMLEKKLVVNPSYLMKIVINDNSWRIEKLEVIRLILQHVENVPPYLIFEAFKKSCESGDIKTVKMLLEKFQDFDINVKDSKGDTILHHLARTSQIVGRAPDGWQSKESIDEILKLLLEKGADPNIQNNEGYSPLHIAATHNFPDRVALLLGRGADPSLDSTLGFLSYIPSIFIRKTPLDLAYGNISDYGELPQARAVIEKFNFLKNTEETRGQNKATKHLNYLLKNSSLENLLVSLKKPYPELLKAFILRAIDEKKVDVLHSILMKYSKTQLGFLKNDLKTIQKINDYLQDSSVPADKLLTITGKLKELSPANKNLINNSLFSNKESSRSTAKKFSDYLRRRPKF